MPTNLTGTKVSETFSQLLHIDGGPAAERKTIYSGAGVATALKLGTDAISVGNICISGDEVFSLTGNLTLGEDLAFVSPSNARTALELGSIALQDADNVSITGGSISDVTLLGTFTGLTTISAGTVATESSVAGLTLQGNTLSSDGPDSDVDIAITPKGSGEVFVTGINVVSGEIPFNTVTNRVYSSLYDSATSDRTGDPTARTAISWSYLITGAGITILDNTKIRAVGGAGTYRFNVSLQFINAENADHEVTIWFGKNGNDIANSATKIAVPQASTGGTAFFAVEIFIDLIITDYVEIYWRPEDADVKLHYVAPVTANPGVTPAMPACPPAILVVERIA